MTLTLDRPTALTDRRSASRPLYRVGGTAPRPRPTTDAVTITVTVTLPAGTGDVETAAVADELRTGAQRLVGTRDGRTTVAVNSPNTFAATTDRTPSRALPPRGQGAAAVTPLHLRRTGVVSPNSPARRDAEAARRRALQATAVSPDSPSAAPEDSLVIDLFGRRVRIDGRDVDFTYKEFELLAQLADSARRTISRTELMETVWAEAPEDTGERTVDVHVRRVRTKLGRYRRLISTVRGVGYRLDPGSDVAILG